MAFYSGFFDSKGLDRTYTAEDFTSYLSCLICDGILDTYGSCFSITAGSGLSITIGTGKAWIKGHFFLSDSAYTLDLSQYVDESLSRYVTIGISCDTDEDVRDCQLEVLQGTAASSPAIPAFQGTDTKKYLTLGAVLLDGGASSISQDNIVDFRADSVRCGYCKCILGKCGLTVLQDQMDDLDDRMTAAESAISAFGITPTATGSCGESVAYTMYSSGGVQLTGGGSTYDYDTQDPWCLSFRSQIQKAVVDDGISSIGNNFFANCENLVSVSLPGTVTEIGSRAFQGCSSLAGITLPPMLDSIPTCLLDGTAVTALSVPTSVQTIEIRAFLGTDIQTLYYGGTKAMWQSIDKKSETSTSTQTDAWDVTDDTSGAEVYLQKIRCTDGTLVRNSNGTWEDES